MSNPSSECSLDSMMVDISLLSYRELQRFCKQPCVQEWRAVRCNTAKETLLANAREYQLQYRMSQPALQQEPLFKAEVQVQSQAENISVPDTRLSAQDDSRPVRNSFVAAQKESVVSLDGNDAISTVSIQVSVPNKSLCSAEALHLDDAAQASISIKCINAESEIPSDVVNVLNPDAFPISLSAQIYTELPHLCVQKVKTETVIRSAPSLKDSSKLTYSFTNTSKKAKSVRAFLTANRMPPAACNNIPVSLALSREVVQKNRDPIEGFQAHRDTNEDALTEADPLVLRPSKRVKVAGADATHGCANQTALASAPQKPTVCNSVKQDKQNCRISRLVPKKKSQASRTILKPSSKTNQLTMVVQIKPKKPISASSITAKFDAIHRRQAEKSKSIVDVDNNLKHRQQANSSITCGSRSPQLFCHTYSKPSMTSNPANSVSCGEFHWIKPKLTSMAR